jgi:tetratricopeptide (TPR) repeat protein
MAQRLSRFVSPFRLEWTASLCVLCLALAIALTQSSSAQTDDSYQSRRTQAFVLYEGNNFVDALPLLEKLHAEKPGDVAVLERLSFATLAHSATLANVSERKQERAQARKLADEAKAAGDDSNLLKIVLSVPEGGGEMAFAGTAEVQAVMQEGEAAFAKGDLDAAIAAYARALALDPQQYDAALFTGDVYFKKKDHEQADKSSRPSTSIPIGRPPIVIGAMTWSPRAAPARRRNSSSALLLRIPTTSGPGWG